MFTMSGDSLARSLPQPLAGSCPSGRLRAGVPHVPAFGEGSAERHRAAGYVELALPAGSGLRRDVDMLEQLRATASLALGPRTRALLEA